ncbi:serine/threonine-protein kinase TBK1 [Anoplophora glabripennis]|uniref:serine/threonine-protein kinase TBK1 n=1 Tax=Anoplophora glabripennis TaxID=217634 RepID=UPI000873C6B9|nr:serine/threonine-protein kinase TBK1 [Anoplophora glabripennis]
MSSYLRGSPNYVWSTTSILGKGATATVHQGVNKVNGEPVAVKTFNTVSTLRPQEVQFREFEVLRKVKHENIVKLLAIEEDQENRGKVIVMELCTGGSLFNSLDDPENTYGLEESEFLLVLAHLYAGMKHLRDNNLIHRDLKPGNIMKFIREDGTTVYKLTDFGAARELQEGQSFQSLYGTEEYLHPDMYERAVLRKPVNKKFGATIDLWSIGVTLYHVATGNLPFRPYGGRKNKETMHHITTKKESGVISGIQTKESGPIEWKRELPVNCQLSEGLKKIITPLLAGLLEADHRKIWSFDRFFKEVDVVLSRSAINIFHVNKARLIKVYILPDETYQHLQNYVTEQTGIKDESQILLYQTNLFANLIQEYTRACGYPRTKEDDPLFLFNKDNNNVTIVPDQELPKWTDFSTVISVENDAAQAKFACSIGHQCKRQIEKYSLYSKLICETVDNFTKYINTELKQLHQNTQHLLDKTLIFKKTAQVLQLSQQISNYSLKSNYTEKLDDISKEFVTAAAVGVTNLYLGHCVENTLKLQWDSISRDLKCPFKTLAPARAKTQVEHLRESWQHLVRDRATRSLSYNDEQFHILERIKITQTINKIKTLLEKEVFPQYEQLAENFGDWYKMAQNIHLKTNILISDVEKYDGKLRDFEEELTIDNVDYTEHIKNNFEQAGKNTAPKKVRNTQNQELKMYLKEYSKNSENFKEILTENTILLNKLSESTMELTKAVSHP